MKILEIAIVVVAAGSLTTGALAQSTGSSTGMGDMSQSSMGNMKMPMKTSKPATPKTTTRHMVSKHHHHGAKHHHGRGK